MTATYTPRPGSAADRAIAHLRTLAHGAELSSAALDEAIGIDPAGITASMAPAVAHHAIYRRTKGGHPRSPTFWSLHDHGAAVANGAPPLPIVAPLFPPLVATEHAVPESFTAGQRVSSRDIVSCCADDRAEAQPAVQAPPSAPATQPAADALQLRIALWSDGSLEMRRGSGLTALLLPDETRELLRYLDHMLTERAAA